MFLCTVQGRHCSGHLEMQPIALQNHKLVTSSVLPKYPADPVLCLIAGRRRPLQGCSCTAVVLVHVNSQEVSEEGELKQVFNQEWLWLLAGPLLKFSPSQTDTALKMLL